MVPSFLYRTISYLLRFLLFFVFHHEPLFLLFYFEQTIFLFNKFIYFLFFFFRDILVWKKNIKKSIFFIFPKCLKQHPLQLTPRTSHHVRFKDSKKSKRCFTLVVFRVTWRHATCVWCTSYRSGLLERSLRSHSRLFFDLPKARKPWKMRKDKLRCVPRLFEHTMITRYFFLFLPFDSIVSLFFSFFGFSIEIRRLSRWSSYIIITIRFTYFIRARF